jgi:hypothetical protein
MVNGKGLQRKLLLSCYALSDLKRLAEVHKLVHAVIIVICIRRIPGSNLDKDTDYIDCSFL